MTKEEVELIIIKVTADGQEAINMKIYKNGTTCRHGAGGIPQLGISAMSFFNNSNFFDPLIAKVPEQILERPLNYEEETPNGYLEFVIAFYGVSKNGDTGEHADWTKSTGVRAKVDHQSSFRDPIMGFLDGLTLDAAEITNEWYFDVVMFAKYKMLSSIIPKETIFALPKTENVINSDFENYINMMQTSARKWSMTNFDKNKTYEKDGEIFKALINETANSFSINFLPNEISKDFTNIQIATNSNATNENSNQIEEKKWWKFWQ